MKIIYKLNHKRIYRKKIIIEKRKIRYLLQFQNYYIKKKENDKTSIKIFDNM